MRRFPGEKGFVENLIFNVRKADERGAFCCNGCFQEKTRFCVCKSFVEKYFSGTCNGIIFIKDIYK